MASIHTAIEKLFATCFATYANYELCMSLGELNARDYRVITEQQGLSDVPDKFWDRCKAKSVDYIIRHHVDPSQYGQNSVETLLVVNVLLASRLPDHPLHELIRVYPDIVDTLQITLGERNTAHHGANDSILSIEEMNERYEFCSNVIRIMLGLKVRAEAEKESAPDSTDSWNDEVLVAIKEILSKRKIPNDVISRNAETLTESYVKKSIRFLSECQNFLSSIYQAILYRNLTGDEMRAVMSSVPEDKQVQLNELNTILEKYNFEYRINEGINSGRASAEAAKGIEYLGIGALMQLTILYGDMQCPELFSTISRDYPQLFEITEEIKSSVGHNQNADFELEQEKYNRMLDMLLTMAEKVKE